jgi:hypothetical protein
MLSAAFYSGCVQVRRGGRAGEIWKLEYDLSAVLRWSKSGVWESLAITLAAHISAAGGKGGLIDELLAARGAGSPVVSLMPKVGPSPSTSHRLLMRSSGTRSIAP